VKGRAVSVCRGGFVVKYEGLVAQQLSLGTTMMTKSSQWKRVG